MIVKKTNIRSLSIHAFIILNAMTDGSEHAGTEFIRKFKVPSGTLYPVLRVLAQRGLLQERWEEVEPQKAGRPRRHLYSITNLGQQLTFEILEMLLPKSTSHRKKEKRGTVFSVHNR